MRGKRNYFKKLKKKKWSHGGLIVSHLVFFFYNNFLKKFNLKLWVNLKFYKKNKGYNCILPHLMFKN
jgi:hypothetical protein